MDDTADAAMRTLVRLKARIQEGGYHYRMPLLKRPTPRRLALAIFLVQQEPESEPRRKRLAELLMAEALHQVADEAREKTH